MGRRQYEEAVELITGVRAEECDLVGPRHAELIAAAEEFLGVCFPRDYRDFVTQFGAGAVNSEWVFGVIDDAFTEGPSSNGVKATWDARNSAQRPGSVIVVGVDGLESHFVMDTAESDDPPVRAWVQGGTQSLDEAEVVFPSFGEFLLDAAQQEPLD